MNNMSLLCHINGEVMMMAKAGMKRPDGNISTESNKIQHKQRNDIPPVPEIQGKAKTGNVRANRAPE